MVLECMVKIGEKLRIISGLELVPRLDLMPRNIIWNWIRLRIRIRNHLVESQRVLGLQKNKKRKFLNQGQKLEKLIKILKILLEVFQRVKKNNIKSLRVRFPWRNQQNNKLQHQVRQRKKNKRDLMEMTRIWFIINLTQIINHIMVIIQECNLSLNLLLLPTSYSISILWLPWIISKIH